MPAKSSPRIDPAGGEYVYRRSLNAKAMLPAIGAAAAVGAAVFYLTYVWLQRTPLVPRRSAVAIRPPRPPRTLGG